MELTEGDETRVSRRRTHHRQHHRVQNERDKSSSSSVADEDVSVDTTTKRRRKQRKRTYSTHGDSNLDHQQRLLRRKAAQIEFALIGQEDEDLKKLRELATTEGGLLNDQVRKKVWPRLVRIDVLETCIVPSQSEIEAYKDYHQVVMDVNRSLKRFPPGISDQERPGLQDQLTRLIVRVLRAHPDLHYYQGYHDVAITFLLVVGEEMAYQIVERLSTGPWLKEFMTSTMERTTYLLHFMYPVLEKEDKVLHAFLERSEVGTVFALPWLITWFGHVLPNYTDVVRLYDFFLAQPPMMAVYLAAAIVLHRREDVLKVDCDLASVHGLLARIPLDSPPFEQLLVSAKRLYDHHPPKKLEKDVQARVKRLEEALVRQTRTVMRRRNKPKGSWLKKVLFITAPVVIGVIVWKYFNHSSSF